MGTTLELRSDAALTVFKKTPPYAFRNAPLFKPLDSADHFQKLNFLLRPKPISHFYPTSSFSNSPLPLRTELQGIVTRHFLYIVCSCGDFFRITLAILI